MKFLVPAVEPLVVLQVLVDVQPDSESVLHVPSSVLRVVGFVFVRQTEVLLAPGFHLFQAQPML